MKYCVECRNILHAVKQRKANWIGDIICRNCLIDTCYGRKGRRDGKARKRHQQLLGTLRKRQSTATWKKKHYSTLLGELEKACCKTNYIMSGECVCVFIGLYTGSFKKI